MCAGFSSAMPIKECATPGSPRTRKLTREHSSFRIRDHPGVIGWRLKSKYRGRPFPGVARFGFVECRHTGAIQASSLWMTRSVYVSVTGVSKLFQQAQGFKNPVGGRRERVAPKGTRHHANEFVLHDVKALACLPAFAFALLF